MSRATVRAAIAAWCAPPNIANLINVHTAKPRNWSPTEFRVADPVANPYVAGAYVHIESVVDERAATGKRFLEYTCALVVLFKSTDTNAEATMGAYDTLVDAIKARLRTKDGNNQSLGSANVYQAAEELLEDVADLPQEEPGIVTIWTVIRFDVSEWINA